MAITTNLEEFCAGDALEILVTMPEEADISAYTFEFLLLAGKVLITKTSGNGIEPVPGEPQQILITIPSTDTRTLPEVRSGQYALWRVDPGAEACVAKGRASVDGTPKTWV